MRTTTEKNIRQGWKAFTHDWTSPVQGGGAVFSGEFPFDTAVVGLDTSSAECAPGWNYCGTIEAALKLGGMWPTGRPVRVVRVAAAADAIERGEKRRASGLRLLREATEEEVFAGIRRFSEVFGEQAETMTESQVAWRKALGRPEHDRKKVEGGLLLALATRKLAWKLKEFPDSRFAKNAWAARADWAALDVWAARDAWDAKSAWDDAWADARAARAARDAWDAWDAWAALVVQFSAGQHWIVRDPMFLTVGLRDAYMAGLETVVPTGANELGWAMKGTAKTAGGTRLRGRRTERRT